MAVARRSDREPRLSWVHLAVCEISTWLVRLRTARSAAGWPPWCATAIPRTTNSSRRGNVLRGMPLATPYNEECDGDPHWSHDRRLQHDETKVGDPLPLLDVPMGTLLHQALMLGTALLLALPPGWCCLRLQGGKALAFPCATTACCAGHSASPLHLCPTLQQERHSPAQASICCCAADTPMRESSETARADLTSWSPATSACAGVPLVTARIVGSFSTIAASPPLQLLHCAWLC
jgi:hypothetical protein